MSALLSAVPQEEAVKLLLAYLRDDCPSDWEDKIQLDIIVTSLQEASPIEAGSHRADRLDEAMIALTRAATGSGTLRDWLITTAHILNLIGPDPDI